MRSPGGQTSGSRAPGGARPLRDPTRGQTEANRCWTLTNMQEATPDVMTPMCWSMWTPLGELAARRAWHSLGIILRSMVEVTDRRGRRFRLVGELLAGAPRSLWSNIYSPILMLRWECDAKIG